MIRIVMAMVMAVILSACGVVGGPAKPLVEQAIALEISQTQQVLNDQLRLESLPSEVSISRVHITEKTPLTIQNLQSYRVRGTYDLSAKLATRQITQKQNPFEIYLQRQLEGKTWRLAQRQTGENGEPVWVTRRLTY